MKAILLSRQVLNWAVMAWYIVTTLGMWIFVYFIYAFYGPTVNGDFETWNQNSLLTHGYLAEDKVGNLMFLIHFLLAGILTAGGTVQLIPYFRRKGQFLHRWNGRVFLFAAFIVTLSGLGMNLIRDVGKHGDSWPSPIDVNGILIIVFVCIAWFRIRKGRVDLHRVWALRSFVVISGVWFLRVGVAAWITLTTIVYGEPQNVNQFFEAWKWGCFLVPLLILECYLLSNKRNEAVFHYVMSAIIFISSILLGVGIMGAYQIFWGPLL